MSMSSIQSEPGRHAHIEIRGAERQLLIDGKAAKLGARAFDVLLALYERRDRLVTKNELIEVVWPGVVVEENNLQVQISTLRKLLGPRTITTIPGRGYQFTLGVDTAVVDASRVTPRLKQNLPGLLTTFIGRDRELAECAQRLETARLLTLTGIGGCGKTRLALRLAEAVIASFPDGVWFVDLAAIAEAERVALSVATIFGVHEESNTPIEDTLERHLAGKVLLLVLDNCEHLLDVCAPLAERLLLRTPGLKVVATSREGLGIAGENLSPVRPLSVPPANAHDLEALLASDAVRLFIDRARLAAPQFELDASNATAVGEICRRLDGIPLAIELAAARVKLLSAEQIRARLNDRFRLLTGTTRMLSRQQTLHAALQWSYQNLTPNEQQMLRRLSVFADGCTLEAAAAVAGDDRDEIAVLESLERLVDHALIVVDDMPAADAPRYRMLETVRQFAQERLQDSGEGDAMRERHLAHFLAYAKTAAPALLGDDVVQWSARLDAEQSNLLAAHAWCSAAGDGANRGMELATALRNYWLNRGLFSLGRQVYEEALDRPGVEPRSLHRAGVLFSLAQLHYHQWQICEMRALTEEALAIAREHDDDGWLLRCLFVSALALGWGGESVQALACAEECIAVAQRMGGQDFAAGSAAFSVKGEVLRAQGRFADALEAQEAALRAHGERRDVNLPARLRDVARAAIALGDLERARETLTQAMRVLSELRMRHYASWYIQVVSRLAAACTEWNVAARLQGAADAIIDKRGGVRHGQDDEISAELRERTKTTLGAQAYAKAYDDGYGLTLDQACDETVGWLEAAH